MLILSRINLATAYRGRDRKSVTIPRGRTACGTENIGGARIFPNAIMPFLNWLLILSSAYPLGRAWRANRQTTLLQAVNWAIVAWAGWVGALCPHSDQQAVASVHYLAL